MAIPFPPGATSLDDPEVHAWAESVGTSADNYNFKTVTSDSGSAVADQTADTLGIVGAPGVTTSVSGDTLTINYDFTNLTAETTLDSAADLFIFYDDSASNFRSCKIDDFEAQIDHDSLSNVDSNEHIDHTSVSITAGGGLTGGGTIAATRTLDLNITTSSESSGYLAVSDDVGKLLIFSGTTNTLGLDEVSSLGDGWVIFVRNQGSGNLTINPDGAVNIDGSSSKTVSTATGVTIICTGSEFYTV